MQPLSAEQLHALYFEALTDKRTLAKAYAGRHVGTLVQLRIERAVMALRRRGHVGFPMPPALAVLS